MKKIVTIFLVTLFLFSSKIIANTTISVDSTQFSKGAKYNKLEKKTFSKEKSDQLLSMDDWSC